MYIDLPSIASLLCLCVGVVFLFAMRAVRHTNKCKDKFFTERKQRVLLVIAHPDDECMFFTPCLVALHELGHTVSILCLSTGNADGLGAVRKQELQSSCGVYGIMQERIHIVDDASLQDGQENRWPIDRVGYFIEHLCRLYKYDAIFTFDENGVSGHLNHSACFHGVKKLLHDGKIPNTRVYCLISLGLLYKYSGILGLLHPRRNQQTLCFSALFGGGLVAHKAMKKHRSQYVWFRRLYVIFSRYVYVNEFCEITQSQIKSCK